MKDLNDHLISEHYIPELLEKNRENVNLMKTNHELSEKQEGLQNIHINFVQKFNKLKTGYELSNKKYENISDENDKLKVEISSLKQTNTNLFLGNDVAWNT